jgi:hypothetical protein
MPRKSLKSMFSRKKKVISMTPTEIAEQHHLDVAKRREKERKKMEREREKKRKEMEREREKKRKEMEKKKRSGKVAITSSTQPRPQQRDDSRMSSSVEERPDVTMINVSERARKLQQDRRTQALEAQQKQAEENDPMFGIDLTFSD